MNQLVEIKRNSENCEWAIRSEFWNSETGEFGKSRKKRERNSNPLILCGQGVSMRIENGALLIRDGFTHYPQKQEIHRYFPGSLDIPTRILLLDGSGTLSFDVLSWLGEQGVALLRIKWTGEISIAASGNGYVGEPAKVKWQEETRDDDIARLAFSIGLIRRKLEQSASTLNSCFAESLKRDRAVSRILELAGGLKSHPPKNLKTLRASEAVCASTYFSTWQELEMQWKNLARRPIPRDWLQFNGRPSVLNGTKPKNVNASHPVNATLNYAYAVRQGQLQLEAIADGYDPTIGIMHKGRRGLPAYVFDLIEPERPKVDAAVLQFIRQHTFSAEDFIIRKDGICRLSPQLAKAVAMQLII